jgi:hypothetical protein
MPCAWVFVGVCQPWTKHTDGCCLYTLYTHIPCHSRRSSYARIAEADMRHVRSQACVRVRAMCVCVGVPASAPTRASTSRRRQASRSRLAGVLLGVGLQREHRRVEHRLRHNVVPGKRRSRSLRRTALGRSSTHARPLCAAVPPMFACVHVAMCIRVYVDGSPMDTHMCSSAIELSLHLGFSMPNALMHRPFPRRMYT